MSHFNFSIGTSIFIPSGGSDPPNWDPKKEDENKRASIPCRFTDGISRKEFNHVVEQVRKNFDRITELTTDGPVVTGTVRPSDGGLAWNFTIDFNVFGHITGNYWIESEDDDSDLPDDLAEMISEKLDDFL